MSQKLGMLRMPHFCQGRCVDAGEFGCKFRGKDFRECNGFCASIQIIEIDRLRNLVNFDIGNGIDVRLFRVDLS